MPPVRSGREILRRPNADGPKIFERIKIKSSCSADYKEQRWNSGIMLGKLIRNNSLQSLLRTCTCRGYKQLLSRELAEKEIGFFTFLPYLFTLPSTLTISFSFRTGGGSIPSLFSFEPEMTGARLSESFGRVARLVISTREFNNSTGAVYLRGSRGEESLESKIRRFTRLRSPIRRRAPLPPLSPSRGRAFRARARSRSRNSSLLGRKCWEC
jgi:hypothetical protein